MLVTVRTAPFKWDVVRQETDFYTLRKLLQLTFPHLLVPPLPANLETKFTLRSMTKRCRKIERFFSAVCKNEHFCTYQLFVELLMIKHKDPKAFGDRLK